MRIDPPARLRDVDPRLRLGAAVAACCVAAGARSPWTPAALLAVACAALALQGMSAGAVLRAFAPAAWLGGLAAALALALTPGEPLLAGAPFPLDAIARDGARRAAVIAARVLAAAAVLRWLSNAAAPAEIEAALAGLGAPAALVELLALARRFAGVLQRAADSAWSAAALRGGFARPGAAARSAGAVAGVVALRTLERSEHAAVAMQLRGYRGELPVADRRPSAPAANLAFAALALAALGLSVAAGAAG
ncbi:MULTISPECIES: CbiQ family ECF transporter T component [Sorangium]|uniref:Cobalt ABC transporter permease n=1 Tax=Sorangium cellulosum TaxID=56 RepID=A0A4P2QG29_SORCE|nr:MULTISPECIES: CbiQ family ECF transporter T component [Sorangium]AUX28428.1 cobalt ABC transporter permease [Sorangium cellulosum]WCQ87820.1 Energy-coupling factor transporter transmembrane protein EcfT [Sorangium sp. Soce836]